MAAWRDMYSAAPAAFKTQDNLTAIASNGALIPTSIQLIFPWVTAI
jgi:hypothetical protein